MLAKLRAKWSQYRDKKQRIEAFRKAAIAMLSDGILSDAELQQLDRVAGELGLDQDSVRSVRHDVFLEALNKSSADDRITPEQQKSLARIAFYFGIEEKQLERSRGALARMRILHEIDQGRLPTVPAAGVVLKRGEIAHWLEPAAILEEKVVAREYVGGSRGTSIRLAKGVSFRVGASPRQDGVENCDRPRQCRERSCSRTNALPSSVRRNR